MNAGTTQQTVDPRVRGESYKVEVYEQAIGQAFEHVAVSSRLKVDTVAIARRPDPDGGDDLAMARIARERDRAALRFARDRDLCRLEARHGPIGQVETAAHVPHALRKTARWSDPHRLPVPPTGASAPSPEPDER